MIKMKYEIDYIEFWATSHCNLNCRGCSSCSPISEPWYIDCNVLRSDLNRLKDLDITIRNITILGGEPLLHPDLVSVIDTVKNVYNSAEIGLITNGLLLLSMKELFWETCVKNKVKLSITCFPVMDEKYKSSMIDKLNKLKLNYRITEKKQFNKILTQNHSDDIEQIIKACGCKNAFNLKDGKISRCTVPMAVPILNKVFGAGLIETGVCDIYEVNNGKDILDFLTVPNEACKNCSVNPIKVVWEKCGNDPQISDWIII